MSKHKIKSLVIQFPASCASSVKKKLRGKILSMYRFDNGESFSENLSEIRSGEVSIKCMQTISWRDIHIKINEAS